MNKGAKLNSSALLLVGAIGGGLLTPQVMTGPGPEGATPPVSFDMVSKRVVAEAVIGAPDGLLSTGWGNPSIETRVDELRTHEHRVDIDAYEAVRSTRPRPGEDVTWVPLSCIASTSSRS